MATTQRQPDTDLIEHAIDTQQRKDDFFQLVRLLERAWQFRNDGGGTGLVGSDCAPNAEPVRFHVAQGLGFPGRSVERVWREAEHTDPFRHHMAVTFMGLTGPSGVLPSHYSTLVQARLKRRDTALSDFLDLFNHRLLSLYYRAWAKYRPTLQQEDAAHTGRAPAVTRVLQALTGQQPHDRHEARLHFGGHFTRHTRSTATLERLLADFLSCPVAIEGFVGQWLPIRKTDRAAIGRCGRNHHLGQGVLIGRRLWDVQSKIRIHIGPLSEASYRALLPDTARYRSLHRLIRNYAPSHLDIEVRFEILATTHDGSRAAAPGAPKQPSLTLTPDRRRPYSRLGRDTWLGSRTGGTRIAVRRLAAGSPS